MRQDQDSQDGHDVVGPSSSSGWRLGRASTSGWSCHIVGIACPLLDWPSQGCEVSVWDGGLPMGHASWHAQDCHLMVVAKMGLVEALLAAIVGSVMETSASETVGGLLPSISLRPSNIEVPEMDPHIQRILRLLQLDPVRLPEGLQVADTEMPMLSGRKR